MNSEIAKVADFMLYMGSPIAQNLQVASHAQNGILEAVSWTLDMYAMRLKKEVGHDPRIMRAWLMVEELSEVLDALATHDEIKLMDGLADLLYVVIGTAIQFDLPLAEAFDAVHESNMTKRSNPMKVMYKEPSTYKPPNLAKVLEKYRCKQ